MSANTSIEIVADIGGTNARFAWLAEGSDVLQGISALLCADFTDPLAAIRHYLHQLDATRQVRSICLAVAGPIETDWIDLPNNHWAFSRSALEQALGCRLAVINDFSAQLLSVPGLAEHEVQWLGPARPQPGRVIAALGPGTGLGVAGLTVGGEIIPSEGGHLAFAPVDAHEVALLQQLWQHYPRVSVERILSGPGLAALHQANAALAGLASTLRAEAVTAGARQGDALCRQTIHDFIAILGSVAGEVAIALGARGGVWLAGGILPRLDGLYDQRLLRARFNAKGRFTQYCSDIPLALVRAEHTGLRGCVHALRHGYA
jgi:glucokinase